MLEFLDKLIKVMFDHGYLIMGALLAFVTALVRTARDKQADILEALFCALITLGIGSILVWLKMPLILTLFIGSFIGGLGSKWAQEKMLNKAEERLGGNIGDLQKQVEELKARLEKEQDK